MDCTVKNQSLINRECKQADAKQMLSNEDGDACMDSFIAVQGSWFK